MPLVGYAFSGHTTGHPTSTQPQRPHGAYPDRETSGPQSYLVELLDRAVVATANDLLQRAAGVGFGFVASSVVVDPDSCGESCVPPTSTGSGVVAEAVVASGAGRDLSWFGVGESMRGIGRR